MAVGAFTDSGKAVRRKFRRWIAAALGLTVLVWLMGFTGLLALAKSVHDDVPQALAVKLPLLKSHPQLIFAGDSHIYYQIDPALAASLAGMPPGSAVNIAYHAGEPLAFMAAINRSPGTFRQAEIVLSVTPMIANEGIRGAVSYPLDVLARLAVWEQLSSFLPLRLGTLIRFIREAFSSRLADTLDIPGLGAAPPDLGLARLAPRSDYRWPPDISSHEHYQNWNISGPKAHYELAALCDIAAATRKLTVVFAPWAPRYDRTVEPNWKAKDDEGVALVSAAGRRCGFEVLNITAVPGLTQDLFYDELHVNEFGIAIFTRHLMSLLKP